MAPQTRLPLGTRILVTGASGYIGTQTVDVLLSEGYNVRGTTRSAKTWLDQYFTDKYGPGRYESVVVQDLEQENTLDGTMEGIGGVVHLATDTSFSADVHAVVSTVVTQTLGVLKSASKTGDVKAFVLVSSSTAAALPKPNVEGIVLGQESWNDEAVTAAYSGEAPAEQMGYLSYAASKTEGERAAWKWVRENKPGFVFNTVLPNMNLGEVLIPEKVAGSTMGWIRDYVKGAPTLPVIETFPGQWYIDVRDDARLIVAALLESSVQETRLYGFAKPFTWTEVLGILRRLRPDNDKLPADPKDEGRDLSDVWQESKRSEDLIKSFFGVQGWTSLEESLSSGIKDL